jgi:hypothetical protein
VKVGDLVRGWYTEGVPGEEDRIGIVMCVDNSHRQCSVDVLFGSGLKRGIWAKHLEAINESR